ncbi:MAG: hypothetical protein ACK52I_37415 [Pseudomonadota bacterium]
MKFLPDAPPTTAGVLLEVEAVPTVRGYAGAPAPVSIGYSALAADCTGATVIFRLDGTTRLLAGTQAALYEGSGGVWTDRSRGGGYSTGDVRWSFAVFGNTSLAINKSTVLQSSTTGAFANVGNAPKASLIETVGGFVMLADTDDSGLSIGGLAPNSNDGDRWWTSQLGNPTGTWQPNVSLQCVTGRLTSSPGKIVALKRLGDQIVAYKSRAIHVGTYVGVPEVFSFAQVPGEIGAVSNEAVVSIGSAHLFIGAEDVYLFDGSRPVPIGTGVREWFFARLNKAQAFRIAGLHDRNTSTVWWWYPSGDSSVLNAALVYNYKAQTWGHVTSSVTLPLQSVTESVTYDTLAALYATYDDLPDISYDSPFWQASAPILAVFDASDVIQSLTGASLGGSLTTSDYGDQEAYSFCSRVRPLWVIKPPTATLTHTGRVAQGEIGQSSPAVTLNGDRWDLRKSFRWHRFTVAATGPFEVAAMTPTLAGAGRE